MQETNQLCAISISKLANQSNLLMGENLLNHCLVRYTERSIITQFRMCNHQTLNLQEFNSIMCENPMKPCFVGIY